MGHPQLPDHPHNIGFLVKDVFGVEEGLVSLGDQELTEASFWQMLQGRQLEYIYKTE